ncbi:Far3p PWA37_000570 [Arxiozyma heterogenica]|uniref:Uncharacterized protein n=1 Tax=Arxiozyma heterogenica TaxID=278026 RepID=A0AAN8A8B8_9SACH|nr:hypothetical protein RI543_000046 [Kazachstania heterogenica]
MNTDSFEYLYQLTKTLSESSRASRQETDKIELLLKRVAKQSIISYEQLSKDVALDVKRKHNNTVLTGEQQDREENEIQKLIKENYRLIYEIEQEEYLNKKFMSMIENVEEQLQSIKNYIIELKLTREQDIENFIYENIQSKTKIVLNNSDDLKLKNDITEENISNNIVKKFRDTYKNLNLNEKREEGRELLNRDKLTENLEQEIDKFEERYKIKLR